MMVELKTSILIFEINGEEKWIRRLTNNPSYDIIFTVDFQKNSTWSLKNEFKTLPWYKRTRLRHLKQDGGMRVVYRSGEWSLKILNRWLRSSNRLKSRSQTIEGGLLLVMIQWKIWSLWRKFHWKNNKFKPVGNLWIFWCNNTSISYDWI